MGVDDFHVSAKWVDRKKSGRRLLLDHPETCPNCKSDEVYYARFDSECEEGVYHCDYCGWAIDAGTGKLIDAGEGEGE